MNEERMTILKMVAEGKITAEEGESLLQTLDTLDEPTQDSVEQSPSEGERESFVELLKAGSESLKDQGQLSREFRRVLKNSARDRKRGPRRYRGRNPRACHEEPRTQVQLETGERFDLEIDSRHGDIEVKSWTKNSLQVDYQITVWAGDEETAKEIASEIEIRIEPEKDASDRVTRASITTNYPEEWGLWRNSGSRARVDYWLVVPQQTNLELDHRHGDVSVDDLRGTTTIGNRHGNVFLGAIEGNLNLDAPHGNVEADSIRGNVCFKGGHGNANLGKVGGNFEGDHRHGHLELDGVGGDLTLAHRHGNAVVHSVGGTIEVNKGHGRIELGGVRDTFHIDAHHADPHLDVVAPFGGDCVIKGHHAKVNLVAPENAFASIQASTYRGSISSEFEGDLTKEKREQQFTATSNTDGANLQVSNHHGGIDLRCRA
ncbi:hypothetical protein C6502_20900 [Candidatus Poribacteria bacterium]|nr:MAG: hypothetical protein C6502_20900 [Candidatus Poribacteria bacterium]